MAWEEKEYIAFGAAVISSVSLVVSFITYRQKDKETKRSIRVQITDSIKKLDDVFAESEKHFYENRDKQPDSYFFTKRIYLNGQKRHLAKQALFLINSAPHLANDFEFCRVADAFSSMGDYDDSNQLYLQAIAKATGYYKAICLRGYARSLFEQGDYESGRVFYQQAVDLTDGEHNSDIYNRAETYQRWAQFEAENQFMELAAEKVEMSRKIYSMIRNEKMRKRGLENLSNLEQYIKPGVKH